MSTRRRTSVYTIRCTGRTAPPAVADMLRAAGIGVCDLGEGSVSFRTTDDAAALQIATDATEGGGIPHTLTTGLGVHRRRVSPL